LNALRDGDYDDEIKEQITITHASEQMQLPMLKKYVWCVSDFQHVLILLPCDVSIPIILY